MLKKILDKAEEYFLVYSLAFSVLLVFAQVVMRYVFQNSLSWSEELARYLFLWISWVGASFAVCERSHFRVEILPNMLCGRRRDYFELCVFAAWFAFCIFLTWQGGKATYFVWKRHQVSAALQIPIAFAYASVPVGAGLMSIRVWQEVRGIIKRCFGKERT